MHITEVGKLFIPDKTAYNEGVYFEYAESGPYLIFALKNPTESEIEAAKKGEVEFALYEAPPVIFLLHKVQGLGRWSDSPFSIRLYKDKTFNWSEPVEEGLGLAFHIVLVNADTGILLAQRIVGTSTRFARELRAAIMRQYEAPFCSETFNRKIDDTYRSFTTKELLTFSIARHKTGRS